MRILGEIAIYGRWVSLNLLSMNAAILNGQLKQLGLKRTHPPPPADSWVYRSPLYRFGIDDTLDEELYSFLLANRSLGQYLDLNDTGIEYAHLTLIPVEQTSERRFACLLAPRTISLLNEMMLGLEIAPVEYMQDYPFWDDRNNQCD
jgi:hypothetical protein